MSHPQPKKPCKHIQGLIDYAIDNKISIYSTDDGSELPENVRCYRCKRIFNIDTSGYVGAPESYEWEEIFI